MRYYITENIDKYIGVTIFAMNIIKGYNTIEEAREFVNESIEKWRDEGLNAEAVSDDNGEVWGATAVDETLEVKHIYNIFASPIFMDGFKSVND